VLLNTEALLPRTYTGEKIGVAVIDSGILPNANEKVVVTYDFTKGGAVKVGAQDPFGHGTHVAGLVGSAGVTSNDLYEGIAPAARLIALRVLDQNGSGYTSNVINAINFAVANKDKLKIDVINLSLGHPIYEPASTDPLVQAVEDAATNGIVVVVSAGNFGGDPSTHVTGYGGVTSPGNAPDAITVGALETYQSVTRGDDSVAWYSSRGPTWYDGFQKPDVVAPGSHLVSDVPTSSTLAKTYPGGLIKTSGTTNLTRLSGTSMAAGVVSGVVSLMLDASRTNHPGALLPPNAVKAILQYTALPLANDDTLTQGAGALNAAGAIALAAAIDPNQPVGASWLTSGVTTSTTIGDQTLDWGQRVVWGDRVIWGNQIFNNDPAWALRVVWGDRVIWGNRVVWGNSTVWDGNAAVWADRVVWGNGLIGQTRGNGTVTWGNVSSDVTASRVVWGNLQDLAIAPTSISWGNLERANGDLVAK
jgi:serine protease AprX